MIGSLNLMSGFQNTFAVGHHGGLINVHQGEEGFGLSVLLTQVTYGVTGRTGF
jgi:hypothetical protein